MVGMRLIGEPWAGDLPLTIISFQSGAVRQEFETDGPAIGEHDVAVVDPVAAARGDDAGQVSDARVMPGGRQFCGG